MLKFEFCFYENGARSITNDSSSLKNNSLFTNPTSETPRNTFGQIEGKDKTKQYAVPTLY